MGPGRAVAAVAAVPAGPIAQGAGENELRPVPLHRSLQHVRIAPVSHVASVRRYGGAVAIPFRVLAIDGGGIRGIIPATVLVDLERRLAPRRVANAFDLIVGTSTGGIIALGLTVPDGDQPRHPAERLLELYLTDAETIFPGGGPATLPQLPQRLREGARYSVAGLEELLDNYLGDTRLTAAVVDVVVTSYDLAYGEPVMLSSRMRSGFVSDVSMIAAARATCAAPTFFKPQVITDGDRERPSSTAACT